MSEPMEDKRLESGVEEIAEQIVADSTIHLSGENSEDVIHFVRVKALIKQALQAERDKQTTLQSQITALKSRLAQLEGTKEKV